MGDGSGIMIAMMSSNKLVDDKSPASSDSVADSGSE